MPIVNPTTVYHCHGRNSIYNGNEPCTTEFRQSRLVGRSTSLKKGFARTIFRRITINPVYVWSRSDVFVKNVLLTAFDDYIVQITRNTIALLRGEPKKRSGRFECTRDFQTVNLHGVLASPSERTSPRYLPEIAKRLGGHPRTSFADKRFKSPRIVRVWYISRPVKTRVSGDDLRKISSAFSQRLFLRRTRRTGKR